MQAAIRSKLLFAGFVAIIALAIAAIMLYGAKKRRDLESSAAASVAAATADLRQAVALAPDAPGAADTLEQLGAGLEARLQALRDEDNSRNKALAAATELYLVDVHAILHNQASAARALVAARASSRALAAHLERAETRGPGWIDRALALKTKAEHDNFDLRTSMSALAELLRAHVDTQDKLRAAYPGAPLLEDEIRKQALKAAEGAQEKAAAELERLRRLPVG